jgi:ABC-type thiamine transport system substrate-binding protein
VEYLAYLEAKYPKLAEALQAVAAYFKKNPQYAQYEAAFIKAAEKDPQIVSQFSTFMEHEQELEQEFREGLP